MDLNQLRCFTRVVQAGGFTRAADALGMPKSRVSRAVSTLEAGLGAKLLERTTRALSLTEIGREVLERALAILSAVDDTERAVLDSRGVPRGTLRLTCGVEFGMIAVNGWIAEYLARWPEVHVEAEQTARLVDLVHEGFDLAVRIGPLEESRLAARRLGAIGYGLFASDGYLARHGTPRTPDALERHAHLAFSGGAQRAGWRLLADGASAVDVALRPRLRVDNTFALREAALAGLGIALLPLRLAAGAPSLRRVLPRWAPAPVPVHAVFPGNRWLSPKVRAFVDLSVARFDGAPAQTATGRRRRARTASEA